MTTLTIWYGKPEPMRATGTNQCKMLEFAEKYHGWHTFKRDRAAVCAANALRAKGYLEIAGDQFRINYP